MSTYLHFLRIEPEKCDGRMKCMRICPTEAIRVRRGKAQIREEKCVDCGECITACPNGAIVALTDPFGELTRFRHTVALPSPGLHAQFGKEILPQKIVAGLKNLGFDDAFDLSLTCGEVSFAIQEYLRDYDGPKPLISNACPTVVRLIQVKYPSLIDQVIPIDTPRELAARDLKQKKAKRLGLKEKEIGAFYLTPCQGNNSRGIIFSRKEHTSHRSHILWINYPHPVTCIDRIQSGNLNTNISCGMLTTYFVNNHIFYLDGLSGHGHRFSTDFPRKIS